MKLIKRQKRQNYISMAGKEREIKGFAIAEASRFYASSFPPADKTLQTQVVNEVVGKVNTLISQGYQPSGELQIVNESTGNNAGVFGTITVMQRMVLYK